MTRLTSKEPAWVMKAFLTMHDYYSSDISPSSLRKKFLYSTLTEWEKAAKLHFGIKKNQFARTNIFVVFQ